MERTAPLEAVWESKVLAPALSRFAATWRVAIGRALVGHPLEAALDRHMEAALDLADLLQFGEPGRRHRVDGLLIWLDPAGVQCQVDHPVLGSLPELQEHPVGATRPRG